ncbi:hypothetical protein BFP97_18220 [Roseivirga sp. 4D4]|uniref:hypothetical protein n=1 Tax=Roseivirga sp. 4D4 TaxID=1889784 RepID=UPI00085344D5|nr:hypothetical protein [Roseivirga sp. 4D4]OEK03339.1 hypothetical protein BFP97_18220 [Roseivirga sp. 4D4]
MIGNVRLINSKKACLILGILCCSFCGLLAQNLEDIKVIRESEKDGEFVFYAVNSIANDIHMVLTFEEDMSRWKCDQPLPFQKTIKAGKVRLFKLKGKADSTYNFKYKTHFFEGFGNPEVNRVEYTVPGEEGQEVKFKGVTNLNEEESDETQLDAYYGVGFFVTYIRSLRSGYVTSIKPSAGDPNESFIKITHKDGTVGTYKGIMRGTMKTSKGQYIEAGARLGVAGLVENGKTYFDFSVSYMQVNVDPEKDQESWITYKYIKPLFRTAKKKKSQLKEGEMYIATYPDDIYTQEMTKAEKKRFVRSRE